MPGTHPERDKFKRKHRRYEDDLQQQKQEDRKTGPRARRIPRPRKQGRQGQRLLDAHRRSLAARRRRRLQRADRDVADQRQDRSAHAEGRRRTERVTASGAAPSPASRLPSSQPRKEYIAMTNKYRLVLKGPAVDHETAQRIRTLCVAAPWMRDELRDGINAAQRVIDTWSQGDLAGAVNGLEEWIASARETLAKAGVQ